MDLHILVRLKAPYEAWKSMFDDHAPVRAGACDETRTLVGKASDTTALISIFDVDMEKMGAMMADPEFQKLTEPLVEEHIVYTLSPLAPPS
jgi:hypothetical protein